MRLTSLVLAFVAATLVGFEAMPQLPTDVPLHATPPTSPARPTFRS